MEPSVITPGAIPAAQRPRFRDKIPRSELWLLFTLIVAFVAFRIRFFLFAGALWRDEVNSVDLSTSPHISDIWHNLQYDSFPMLWHLVLRAWIFSGIGSSDLGIRLLGLLAGIGVLIAILVNARRFRTVPLVALALLGFSSAVICDGGSIRGYGLGMMLELFTFGAMWEVATRPNVLRITIALLLSLAAVHMLFYNSVILAAICCGAALVAASHRRWNRCAVIMGIGAICAASMTIYAPAIHRASTFRPMLLKEPSLTWLLTKFVEAVSYDASTSATNSAFNLIAWEVTVLLALFLGFRALVSKRKTDTDPFRKDVVIYHLAVLCAGLLGYTWFLWRLSYLMQPWYYLALMALLAVCCDGLISSVSSEIEVFRGILCVAVVGFCLTTVWPIWSDSGLRKTAVDTDSRELARIGKKGDLIIISPWYYGVTFQRYYHGAADYVTIPPVKFLTYHNYDLLIPWLKNPDAMDGIIARATGVLKSGHIVYLFGGFQFPCTDRAYPKMDWPPLPDPAGWHDGQYYLLWQAQIVYVLSHHSRQGAQVYTDFYGVSNYERPTLFALRGWSGTPRVLSKPATPQQSTPH